MSRSWAATGFLLLNAALMVALVFVRFSWAGFLPEACGLRNCYCESFRSGYLVLQPVNALSNLGYVLVGALILGSRGLGSEPAPRRFTRWFGAAAVITGWCSYLSHASLTRLGEWLDLMGIYQLLLVLLVYSLHRLTGKNWNRLFLTGIILGALQMAFWPVGQQAVIGLLIAGWAVAEFAARRRLLHGEQSPKGEKRFTILAVLLFAAGAGIWAVNGRSPECPPGSFYWHVAWHLLSAAAFGSLYLFFQSEARPRKLT